MPFFPLPLIQTSQLSLLNLPSSKGAFISKEEHDTGLNDMPSSFSPSHLSCWTRCNASKRSLFRPPGAISLAQCPSTRSRQETSNCWSIGCSRSPLKIHKQQPPRSFSSCACHAPLPAKKTAYIALGSNLGDRVAEIEKACNEMDHAGIRVKRTSSLYETQPMYVLDQNRFLNGVCEVSFLPFFFVSTFPGRAPSGCLMKFF